MSNESANLDTRDQAILAFLHDYPLEKTTVIADSATIARETGIPGSTVRRRLQRLRDDGAFRCRSDLAKAGFHSNSMVSLDINIPEAVCGDRGYDGIKELAQFLRHKLLESPDALNYKGQLLLDRVDVVFRGGMRCDLVVFIASINEEAAGDFVTMILANLPGVRDTQTARIQPVQ